ncbi:GTP-binding protein [Geotalea toluenoxydans]|uniref:GTP-binding protein n=1 Tax=Geotalea toluenoxydans TaxID=421624 RepID=UPI0006D055D9|nr:Rab family GTPase [Geotalea toluenoxydans]
MIEFNEKERRMVLKLVYYGPAMSGKTTNLLQLHELLKHEGRGDLMVLDTTDDRTIYFDLLPFFIVAPSGLKIKVKVYTVPGQVRHDATRKAVLQRADGVAFIADSQLSQSTNNLASFESLENNLALVGLDVDSVPLVIQFNKRDLSAIVAEEDILHTWEPTGIPVTMAAAIKGSGVVETFSLLVERLYDRIDDRYRIASDHGLNKRAFVNRMVNVAEQEGD